MNTRLGLVVEVQNDSYIRRTRSLWAHKTVHKLISSWSYICWDLHQVVQRPHPNNYRNRTHERYLEHLSVVYSLLLQVTMYLSAVPYKPYNPFIYVHTYVLTATVYVISSNYGYVYNNNCHYWMTWANEYTSSLINTVAQTMSYYPAVYWYDCIFELLWI